MSCSPPTNALLRYFLLGVSLALAENCAAETPREHLRIDDNWKFLLGDPKDASTTDFADSDWRSVTLPHDWSIEGKMDPKAPMGGQGGFLPAGIGWYRHHWQAPADWKGKRVRVEFEGVYMNADVFLNGQKLDSHPYGFTSFFVDLTPALKTGYGNVLAVRVDNSEQKNARWYTGSGIYRHVWLDVTDAVQVAPWGVFVSVPKADAQAARISVQTTLLNQTAATTPARITTALRGPDGVEIGRGETSVDLAASGSREIKQEIALPHPPLWFPETPRLSTAVTDVIVDDKTIDEVTTRFGVRALAWSVEKGLTLNGKTYKLAGGCIHEDNGVLGACAFDRPRNARSSCSRLPVLTRCGRRTIHRLPDCSTRATGWACWYWTRRSIVGSMAKTPPIITWFSRIGGSATSTQSCSGIAIIRP